MPTKTNHPYCEKYGTIAGASVVLNAFSRYCASLVLDQWPVPEIVKQFLETGDEDIRENALKVAVESKSATSPNSVGESDACRAAIWALVQDGSVYPQNRGLSFMAGEHDSYETSFNAAWSSAWCKAWVEAEKAENNEKKPKKKDDAWSNAWDETWGRVRKEQEQNLEQMMSYHKTTREQIGKLMTHVHVAQKEST